MKPQMTVVWFMTTLALAALLVVQWRNARNHQVVAQSLQQQITQLEQDAKAARASSENSARELQTLRSELAVAERELAGARVETRSLTDAARQATPALSAGNRPGSGTAGKSEGPANFMKEMMENPEMQKMMKAQQKTMMGVMYNPLVKELGLTDEQGEKLKEMLLDRQMKMMTNAGGFMNTDPAQRQAATAKMAEENQAFEAELKQFLGDDKYAQYQDYNSTLAERTSLSMFGSQVALEPEQTRDLLEIMKDEKKIASASSPDMNIDPSQDWQKFLESEDFNKRYFDQQKKVNERVLERARGLLSPDQLKKFQEFQDQQATMQQLGMEMSRKMLGSGAGSPAGPGPAPTPQ